MGMYASSCMRAVLERALQGCERVWASVRAWLEEPPPAESEVCEEMSERFPCVMLISVESACHRTSRAEVYCYRIYANKNNAQ